MFNNWKTERKNKRSNPNESRRRLPYLAIKLIEKVERLRQSGVNSVKTYERCAVIVPEWIGFTFFVHNGKGHIPVHINDGMIGKKLGEFSPTRSFHGHGSNRKDKK